MTTQKKPRIIVPLITSLVELGVVTYAVYSGSIGARNLVYFDALVNALFFTPVLIQASEEKGKDQRPYWVLTAHDLIDAIIVATLVWNGWGWCSFALALGAFASAVYRHRNTDEDQIS